MGIGTREPQGITYRYNQYHNYWIFLWSHAKQNQSSISSHTQSRVTLFSHIVFTLHDVKVNRLRLSYHPYSFKGVHNLFIRNAVPFSSPTFLSALFAFVRFTGTPVLTALRDGHVIMLGETLWDRGTSWCGKKDVPSSDRFKWIGWILHKIHLPPPTP